MSIRSIGPPRLSRRYNVSVAMHSLLSATLLILLTSPAIAWGPTGHRVVAKVAENHLSPQAAAAVKKLLSPDTLIEAANWPDEIRSDPAWLHAGPFHFISIPDGQTYQRHSREPDQDPRDIVEAIEHFQLVLKNGSARRSQRADALRWIVHLIGDIHQPLHVGRAEDKGGNDIPAVWHGELTNMHQIWDEDLIDTTRLSYSEFAKSIDTASAEEIRVWQSSTLITWMNESQGHRNEAYKVPGMRTADSYRYSYVNLPLVRKRLQQAGVRVAGTLNEIFTGATP